MNKKAIEQLKEYLLSTSSENSHSDLVHSFFRELFGAKFKKESDAQGADGYVEGKLVVELKANSKDVFAGLFQGLHYNTKGLTFTAVCVITQKFVGLWQIKDLPKFVTDLANSSDNQKAPSEIGRLNAKLDAGQKSEILNCASFKIQPFEFEEPLFVSAPERLIGQFVDYLNNLEAGRIQINPQNFITKISLLERFFSEKSALSAIHCFYAMVGYWDVNSQIVEVTDSDDLQLIDLRKKRSSQTLTIAPRFHEQFKQFVQSHYVFVNSGSGLTADYYFSRFDEVISKLDEQYAIQHGIFFTDDNLSKFALWYVHEYYDKKLSDKYIVLDPAGGSGNLVTSWRGHLKHKIVSELQPDLLRTIEQRMRLDPEEVQAGFTIIPKTNTNEGLNFIDKSAEKYLQVLLDELREKNLKLDKPIAFLLNPPYKNTDENEEVRVAANAIYKIDPSILQLTGDDAGKERYLAFLAQILNIARLQMGDRPLTQMGLEDIQIDQTLQNDKKETPLILIFTPTSWLIPRPTYRVFREEFDRYFKYEKGFIFTGNEFFKIGGRFPISFTIWSYKYNIRGNKNEVKVLDLTGLTHQELEINWNKLKQELDIELKELIRNGKSIILDNSRGDIREQLPHLPKNNGQIVQQPRYDFSTAKKVNEFDRIVSGFPLSDRRRHFELSRKCGDPKGNFIGLYDDNTPVRVKQDNYNRMSNAPNRVWFRLDNDLKSVNKTRMISGPPDKYGFCAYDIPSAKVTFAWFAITKAINSIYPVWANQYDIWMPVIPLDKEKYFMSLCFAFGLSFNGCIVTKFDANNPVNGAEAVFLDNPMSPNNSDSFWSTTLDPYIIQRPALAIQLIEKVKEFYSVWNKHYCRGQILKNVGLHDEPYFKYFSYKDFLTPNSGIMQIKKYAEKENIAELSDLLTQITTRTKKVKEEIYRMLIEDFKYFE